MLNKLRFRVSEALVWGAMMLGQALAYAPDFNQAKVSASKIMKLLDRHPKIYISSSDPKPAGWVRFLHCTLVSDGIYNKTKNVCRLNGETLNTETCTSLTLPGIMFPCCGD